MTTVLLVYHRAVRSHRSGNNVLAQCTFSAHCDIVRFQVKILKMISSTSAQIPSGTCHRPVVHTDMSYHRPVSCAYALIYWQYGTRNDDCIIGIRVSVIYTGGFARQELHNTRSTGPALSGASLPCRDQEAGTESGRWQRGGGCATGGRGRVGQASAVIARQASSTRFPASQQVQGLQFMGVEPQLGCMLCIVFSNEMMLAAAGFQFQRLRFFL